MQPETSKQDWRREVAARRRSRSTADREADADALAEGVLALPELAAARTVAAYASYPSEPGTAALRTALRGRGVRVLLPVLLDDRDLDWADDVDGASPLGVDTITSAELVVCPATAVAADGTRLGRGGGSYDRALTRLRPGALAVALLHDDEVVQELPREPHDRRVDVVVTPVRTLRCPPDPEVPPPPRPRPGG